MSVSHTSDICSHQDPLMRLRELGIVLSCRWGYSQWVEYVALGRVHSACHKTSQTESYPQPLQRVSVVQTAIPGGCWCHLSAQQLRQLGRAGEKAGFRAALPSQRVQGDSLFPPLVTEPGALCWPLDTSHTSHANKTTICTK